MGEFDFGSGSDFDEAAVRVALRARAEGAVRIEELLAGARRRGVWRRKVRHTLLGGGTAAALAVGALVAFAAPPSVSPPTPGEREAAEILGVSTLPRPPVAGRQENNLLRLDVADPGAEVLEWTVEGSGLQMLRVSRTHTWAGSSSGQYLVLRGGSEADLDAMLTGWTATIRPEDVEEINGVTGEEVLVGGVVGTLKLSGTRPNNRSYPNSGDRWASLRWTRPDGIWLGIYISFWTNAFAGKPDDRTAILQVAQWVRANVAYQCVADFRLAWIPPGARSTGCRLGLSKVNRSYGMVYDDGKGGRFLTYSAQDSGSIDGSRPIDKWLAGFLSNEERRLEGERVFAAGAPGLSKEDVSKLVDGFVPVEEPIPHR